MFIRIDARAGLKALILYLMSAVVAAAGDALTLEHATAIAIDTDRGRAALLEEAGAHRERAVAAGQLPDPEARIGAMSLPVRTLSLVEEPMTMLEVGVMQRFPAGRSRALSRDILESRALVADASAGLRARDVRLAVARIWHELDYADASIVALEEQRRWAAALIGGREADYASGGADQSALLGARIDALAIDALLIERRGQRAALQAELARWIGDAADEARQAAPSPPLPGTLPALQAQLPSHPLLAGLGHESGSAELETALARERYKPAFGVDLAWGYRRDRDDMVSAMLTFELPLFTRDRQDRELAAARARSRAAEARQQDAERELEGRLRALLARASVAADTLRLHEGDIGRETETGVAAALSAYRAGESSLAEVAAAQRRRIEVRDRVARLRADLRLALAEIEFLTGETP